MNVIDKIILFLSPLAGLRRVRARAAAVTIQSHLRSYEGAKSGRRTEGWVTPGTSAKTEVGSSLTALRDRARAIVRDNPYGSKAVDSLVSNIVGTGIVPKSRAKAERTRKMQKELWDRWVEYADYEGDLNFYGLQELIVRTLVESGEVLIRKRIVPGAGEVPFQVQVLEPDYIDSSKNADKISSGGRIIDGIEFDATGRKIAYWLYPQHPGDSSISVVMFQSNRVSADEIIHVFRKRRPGQHRGVTWFAPIVLAMRDLDEYEDAELLRKKIEACFVAFVTQPEGFEGPLVGKSATTETGGSRVEAFEPGMVEYLKPGESVEFGAPNSNSGYSDYTASQHRKLAVGLGMTYEQLTSDLSRVNYSSYQAGSSEFRRAVELIQYNLIIPKVCRAIRSELIRMAVIAGKLPSADLADTWTTPKWDWVDPERDVKASVNAARSGFISLSEVIRQQGYDRDEVFDEWAEDLKEMDARGLKFDTDPRQPIKAASPAKGDDSEEKDKDEKDKDEKDKKKEKGDDRAAPQITVHSSPVHISQAPIDIRMQTSADEPKVEVRKPPEKITGRMVRNSDGSISFEMEPVEQQSADGVGQFQSEEV